MVEVCETLAVYHSIGNEHGQLQHRDGELKQMHLPKGLDQVVQEIQTVRLHEHTWQVLCQHCGQHCIQRGHTAGAMVSSGHRDTQQVLCPHGEITPTSNTHDQSHASHIRKKH